MYYPPSYLWHFLLQTSVFVYNFYSGVNFAEKEFAVILFCGSLFLRIAKNPAKIAKIRTRKNLVPHGILYLMLYNVVKLHFISVLNKTSHSLQCIYSLGSRCTMDYVTNSKVCIGG